MTHDQTARRLQVFALAIVVLKLVTTAVAVALNLSSQFGRAGTDAGEEFLSVGTAISAPPVPVVLLLLVALLAGRRDRWARVGVAAAYLTAIMVGIGGLGEILGTPTEDVPQSVLLTAGVAWLVIACCLVGLASAVVSARERRRAPRTLGSSPG
jgi:cytochrome bd-type quinol oxidase subunit 2